MKNELYISMTTDYIHVPIRVKDVTEVVDWLDEIESDGTYTLGGNGVYFTKEEDANLCMLRWG